MQPTPQRRERFRLLPVPLDPALMERSTILPELVHMSGRWPLERPRPPPLKPLWNDWLALRHTLNVVDDCCRGLSGAGRLLPLRRLNSPASVVLLVDGSA